MDAHCIAKLLQVRKVLCHGIVVLESSDGCIELFLRQVAVPGTSGPTDLPRALVKSLASPWQNALWVRDAEQRAAHADSCGRYLYDVLVADG